MAHNDIIGECSYNLNGKSYRVVAVEGAIGDWAAYSGPADWSRYEVARRGDKLLDDEARSMFPDITLAYRP
jgi:hypothetical protein